MKVVCAWKRQRWERKKRIAKHHIYQLSGKNDNNCDDDEDGARINAGEKCFFFSSFCFISFFFLVCYCGHCYFGRFVGRSVVRRPFYSRHGYSNWHICATQFYTEAVNGGSFLILECIKCVRFFHFYIHNIDQMMCLCMHDFPTDNVKIGLESKMAYKNLHGNSSLVQTHNFFSSF